MGYKVNTNTEEVNAELLKKLNDLGFTIELPEEENEEEKEDEEKEDE